MNEVYFSMRGLARGSADDLELERWQRMVVRELERAADDLGCACGALVCAHDRDLRGDEDTVKLSTAATVPAARRAARRR